MKSPKLLYIAILQLVITLALVLPVSFEKSVKNNNYVQEALAVSSAGGGMCPGGCLGCESCSMGVCLDDDSNCDPCDFCSGGTCVPTGMCGAAAAAASAGSSGSASGTSGTSGSTSGTSGSTSGTSGTSGSSGAGPLVNCGGITDGPGLSTSDYRDYVNDTLAGTPPGPIGAVLNYNDIDAAGKYSVYYFTPPKKSSPQPLRESIADIDKDFFLATFTSSSPNPTKVTPLDQAKFAPDPSGVAAAVSAQTSRNLTCICDSGCF